MLMNIIVLAQLAATLVVGVYFFRQMRAQSAPERAAHAGESDTHRRRRHR